MDEILELILDFVVEGLIEFSTGQEVPKTVRGICLTLVTTICIGGSICCAYWAIETDSGMAFKVLLGIVALFMLAGGIAFWKKVTKEWKKIKDREKIEL